jgi:Phage tail sheath protein.
MNTAQINFNIVDQSFSADDGIKGVSGYMGVFKRGPVGNTNEIFGSWNRFKRVYGDLIPTSDDPLQVRRMLNRGSKVRVCGIRHFTTIGDPTSLDAATASALDVKVHTLSASLVSGQTITYTIGATQVSQLFTIDSITTLKALATKMVATFPQVDHVYVVSSTKLQVTLLSGVATLTATGAAAPTITNTTLNGFREVGGTELFTITPKYPGANYNDLRVSMVPASNGQANYFDLVIEFATESDYTPEVYPNLIITSTPTIEQSTYLKDVISGSELVNVAYRDLSGLSSPIVPQVNYSRYSGGTDGGAVTDTDYIGDSGAKNGLHAFDTVSDIYAIGCGNTSDAMAIAGAAYAASRQDLQYFHHFDNALKTPAQIVAKRDSLNINTPFIEFWCGGLNILDPLTNLRKDILAIGDILGVAAYSEITAGAYRSFAGTQRGLVYDAFGVVNNFGATADLTSLNLLSNHQVNAVINVDNQIELSGNFSGQLATSHLSFNNVIRLIIYIKRSLRPLLKQFIEEPNDIPTWKDIYLTVKPFMDGLVSPARALFDYRWQGDQFANSYDDLKVNDITQVGLGKYTVVLSLKDITSLREFNILIVITASSVSFEDSPAQ